MVNQTFPSEQQALQLAERIMARSGVKNLRRTLNHEPSWWLRCQLAEIDRNAINGRLRTCAHADAQDLQVVALWQPDTVWCLGCAGAATRLEGDPDRTCDRCGTVVERIDVLTLVSRQVLVFLGLCGDCHAREGGAA